MKTIGYLSFLLILLMSFGCSGSASKEELKETISAFSASIDSANRATAVINNGKAFSIMGPEESDKMIGFYKEALNHAHEVDYELLNQSYNGLGNHFENKFVAGIELILSAHETLDKEKALKGQNLLNQWGVWFQENYSQITENK